MSYTLYICIYVYIKIFASYPVTGSKYFYSKLIKKTTKRNENEI